MDHLSTLVDKQYNNNKLDANQSNKITSKHFNLLPNIKLRNDNIN